MLHLIIFVIDHILDVHNKMSTGSKRHRACHWYTRSINTPYFFQSTKLELETLLNRFKSSSSRANAMLVSIHHLLYYIKWILQCVDQQNEYVSDKFTGTSSRQKRDFNKHTHQIQYKQFLQQCLSISIMHKGVTFWDNISTFVSQ